MKRTIKWEKWENNFCVSEEEGEDEDSNKHIPFIQTQYGAISQKMFAPEKNNLNLWCGHTNFDLRANVECLIIDDTPGVEMFDLFSAYRFRVCIGLNFDEDKVKKEIAIRLDCVSHKIKNLNLPEIQKLKIDLKNKKQPWIIYVLPNGRYEYNSYDALDKFNFNLEKYQKTKIALGGKVLYGV